MYIKYGCEVKGERNMSVCCIRDYFIKIEDCQNNVIAVVKVLAENEKEAEVKALAALHKTQSISEVDKKEVKDLLETNEIDYVLDEEGDEADVDEIYEEDSTDEEVEEKYILHLVNDQEEVENSDYSEIEEAIAEACQVWNDGECEYKEVSVHCVSADSDESVLNEETRIWIATK